MSGWDKGVPYEQLKNNFTFFFNIKLSEFMRKPSKNKGKALVYGATAILQLTNGERAGESMLALRKYIDTKEKDFTIITFKQKLTKKLSDGRVVEKKLSEFKERVVKIPSLLIANQYHIERAMLLAFGHPDNYMPIKFLDPRTRVREYKEYKRYRNRYTTWLEGNFSINTHTLRYAWQNKMSELLPSVEAIAKIQGRSNLNVLLDYIRTTQAKKQYDEVFKFLE